MRSNKWGLALAGGSVTDMPHRYMDSGRLAAGEAAKGRFSFLFSWSEENQDFEFFFDVVKAVFQFSLNKNDRAGFHLGIIGTDLHSGSSFDDVIHLIFAVRFLGIDPAFRQNVHAGAHGWHASEFQVALATGGALAAKIVNVETVRH